MINHDQFVSANYVNLITTPYFAVKKQANQYNESKE